MKKNKLFNFTNIGQVVMYSIFVLPMKYIFNIEVVGKEKIDVKKPLIAIANHQAVWDSFGVLSAMGFRSFMRIFPWRSPIAKDWYTSFWVRIFSKTVGLYPIEPKGELSTSLKGTFDFLDDGYSIFFFPEGRMVKKGEIGEPKKGIGYICQNRDVYLSPVRIVYRGYKANGRGKIWGAKIIFGDLLYSKELREEYGCDNLHRILLDNVFSISDEEEEKNISLENKNLGMEREKIS